MNVHRNIALITDSLCDIPPHLIEQYRVYIVAQYVIWDQEQLRDTIDIDAEGFYRRLATDPVHPKTSQPTAQDFLDKIEQAKTDGAEEVFIVTVSRRLSGTYASAKLAEALADIPVHVHDSRSVSMGQGWQLLAAARARELGGKVAEIFEAARLVRDQLAVVFTVDTLEYLHRGGRIGNAAKLLGTALNLKPQLTINNITGIIEAGEKVRTRKKALERVFQVFKEQVTENRPLFAAVQHANALEEAQMLADRIKQELKPVEFYMGSLTPAVGVHGGPGTIGIVGYSED